MNQFAMLPPAADMPARSGTDRGLSEATGGLLKAIGVGQRNRWACMGYMTTQITTTCVPMPLQATLREDNTLELPDDAPRLARTNTPLQVVDLGSGTFVVTEKEPQVPNIAPEFRGALEKAGVTTEQLLENLYKVKRKIAREEGRA